MELVSQYMNSNKIIDKKEKYTCKISLKIKKILILHCCVFVCLIIRNLNSISAKKIRKPPKLVKTAYSF